MCECKNILEEMREEERCAFPSPDNCANYKVAMRVEKPKILTEAKKKVEDLYRQKRSTAVSKLGFQGEMLKFLEAGYPLEGTDL